MMKKLLILASAALLPVLVRAQAVIAFENKTHDFGTIEEADGRVSHDFVFENQGNAPLSSPGCRPAAGAPPPRGPKAPWSPGRRAR